MTDLETSYNEAVQLRTRGELEAAGDLATSLWEHGFQEPHCALLLGNLALDFGRYQAALDLHTVAHTLHQREKALFGGRPSVQNNSHVYDIALATSRLRMGLWDPFTWQLWENGRYLQSWSPPQGTMPWFGQPDKLLIMFEGGYGDAFLFTRFFQLLDPDQRAQSRFVLNPRFPALNHFQPAWDGVPVLGFVEPVHSFSHSTALMSLMAAFQVKGPHDIPAPASFTPGFSFGIPEWDNTDYFHREPSLSISRGPRIGICHYAEEFGQERRTRSIDNPKDLEPLRGFEFVNLAPARQQISPNIHDVDLPDFLTTARVIAGLDAVVTVDSAVLHLAGLLGVPTFAILPIASDWKHGVTAPSTHWWPSVTLFRNQDPFSWKSCVESVASALEKL